MIIGLTGGIASGKTTVAHILQDLGAEIIDADKIAHRILKKGQPGWKQVKESFGSKILQENGEINRGLLGNIVFSDSRKREKLEEITHPLILKEIQKRINDYDQDGHLILVAPLLYEVGLDKKVDEVWVVYVDESTQLKRLQERDSLTFREARERIEAQLPLDKKKEWADRILDNRGSREKLKMQIKACWQKMEADS